MQPAVLITGRQSTFTDDLIQESLNRGHTVIATRDPDQEEPTVPESVGDRLRYVPWTRRSILSARSVLLDVTAEALPERAIVVCGPEGVRTPLHEMQAAAIEAGIDATLKGYLFMIKELLAAYMRAGGGDLTVVWFDGGAEVMPAFDAVLAGAIESLGRSLVAFYENEPVTIRGLVASESETRAVASWVLEQIDERGSKSAGKWTRYGQKMGLLQFRR